MLLSMGEHVMIAQIEVSDINIASIVHLLDVACVVVGMQYQVTVGSFFQGWFVQVASWV